MTVRILTGDCRDVLGTLPDKSINCCVTSPPYFGLRDYGVEGQIGLEQTPDAFVAEMVAVFREVRRVLRDDGTLWLNLGDSYAGSGKGGNPEEGKQATNRGSQSVGVLYGTGKTAREAAVTNVTRKTFDGIKAKDLIGIPWRVAFALQADGWYLRQDIIWSKPNPMPESVQDRCTKAHEYIFMLSKSARYFYDADAIKEDASEVSIARSERADLREKPGWSEAYHGNPPTGFKRDKQRGHSRRHAGFNDRWDAMEKAEQCGGKRNKRSVWTVATQPFSEAHFATFPPSLIEPCIKAGCPTGGTVLDPFGGAGTTGLVADRLQRDAILIELNPAYVEIARNRLTADAGMFGEVA
jgi:DNA modification methylase